MKNYRGILFIITASLLTIAVLASMSTKAAAQSLPWTIDVDIDAMTDEPTWILHSQGIGRDTSFFQLECAKDIQILVVRFEYMEPSLGEFTTMQIRINDERYFEVDGVQLPHKGAGVIVVEVDDLKGWIENHMTAKHGVVRVRVFDGKNLLDESFTLDGFASNTHEFIAMCEGLR